MYPAAPHRSPQTYAAPSAYGQDDQDGGAIDPSRLAGVPRRLGAVLIDGLLPLVAYLPLALVVWPVSTMEPSSGALTAVGLTAVAVYTALMGYMAYALVQLGQGRSPGKKLLGLRVISLETGRPAGFWRMMLRDVVGKWVSAVVLYLGFFWAIWDERHQGWHDKIAGTVVVSENAVSEGAASHDRVSESTVRAGRYSSSF